MSLAESQEEKATAPHPPNRTLSVIVPVRNHARPLKRLLDNLKAQKPPPGWDVEIMVVEYKSTDNTLEVIRASGVRPRSAKQQGPGAARNLGVKHTRGQLLYFIDADAMPARNDQLLRVMGIAQRLMKQGRIRRVWRPNTSFAPSALEPDRHRRSLGLLV